MLRMVRITSNSWNMQTLGWLIEIENHYRTDMWSPTCEVQHEYVPYWSQCDSVRSATSMQYRCMFDSLFLKNMSIVRFYIHRTIMESYILIPIFFFNNKEKVCTIVQKYNSNRWHSTRCYRFWKIIQEIWQAKGQRSLSIIRMFLFALFKRRSR